MTKKNRSIIPPYPKIINSFLILILALYTIQCQNPKEGANNKIDKHNPPIYRLKDTTWKQLTLRQKIGQTVIWHAKTIIKICEEKQISYKSFFKKYPPGGIFVGAEVIDNQKKGHKHLSNLIAEFRMAVPYPVIICADMETGAGTSVDNMAKFPNLTGIGACHSQELTAGFANSSALEAHSLGINWLFSPVADLIQNPFNYLIDTRCISDDPDYALKHLPVIVKNYQQNGIMATAKHFPGDGVDFRNQHFQNSSNFLSLDEWKNNHGAVFQKLIDDGVAAIMTGHISFPAYQKDNVEEKMDENFLPATLSHNLTTKLLRKEMGFNGVIVSDALIMGGFMKWYKNKIKAELECFKCGTDMLLWPHTGYYDSLETAIKKEQIPMKRLNDAVAKVWSLKEKAGLLDTGYRPHSISEEEQAYIDNNEKTIAAKSLTLIRNKYKLLPVKQADIKNILLVDVTLRSQDHFITNFAKHFEKRSIKATIKRGMWFTYLQNHYQKFDLIIYAVHHFPFQPVMGTKGSGLLWSCLTYGLDKSIVISFDSPFKYAIFKKSPVYINTHSMNMLSQEYVVKGIFGEIPFEGKPPVNLDIFSKFWWNKNKPLFLNN